MTTLHALFVSISLILGLPDGLLSAVCFVESSHRPHVINHDDGGEDSLGLCQIKLSTAKHLGFTGTREQLMNPETNMYYAGKYLLDCHRRYPTWHRALTCYNRGNARGLDRSRYSEKVLDRLLEQTK